MLTDRYRRYMINYFNNSTVARTDWNILLDQTGGPDQVGNPCFIPVKKDSGTGELTPTNSYCYIGQFSKFIRPGIKRISSVSSANCILSTEFINEDSSMVIVTMNQSDEPLDYSVPVDTNTTNVHVPSHAIQSIIISI